MYKIQRDVAQERINKVHGVGSITIQDDYNGIDNSCTLKCKHGHTWRTHPRDYGKDSRACRVCNNTHGLIRKYNLMICRKCFRERAHLIGFTQTR